MESLSGSDASAPATASALAPVLEIRGLVVERRHPAHTFRLEVPDFQVHRGDFVAILGDSGCGKSTLLDVLGLILEPTEVDRYALSVPGESVPVDVSRAWQRGDQSGLARIRGHHLGYVLQTGGLLPFLTVFDNVALTPRQAGKEADEAWIGGLLDTMGIASQRGKKPSSLSGGQRQRVAIVRALAHRPALVLADEPTAAVDGPTARKIIQQFRDLTSSLGTTVLVVTHDHKLVQDVSTRVFRFRTEKVTEDSTRSECYLSREGSP